MNIVGTIGRAFDAIVYAVAPEAGARRMATRRVYEASAETDRTFRARALEAAESDRLREGRWLGSRLSTDAFLEQDLEQTRQNSRELYRNDFVGGAVDSRIEHVVGTGFTVQARIVEADGIVTADEAERFNQQLEDIYAQVYPVACRTRRRSLWQKACLFARNIDVDGEALAVFSSVGNADTPVPLCVEIIDVDRLETPPDKVMDPLCRMGIQYNSKKEIVSYWIRDSHPNDNKEFKTTYKEVPASRVCHVFVEWFAGQSRGLPWMTRSLNRAKDGKDLQEAGIIAAQVEACYAVFIKGKGNALRKAIGAATTTERFDRIQEVRPGGAHYINEDEEVTFGNPTKTNSVGTLAEYNNRTIAAGLNWPYEMLMKDWRGVSFAGGRIVLHSAKQSTRCRQKLIVEGFLQPFWNLLCDQAVAVGAVDIDARVYNENRWRFTAHTWTAPKWSYALTPGEEVDAKVTAIDNNLQTLADALAEDQLDLEQVVTQRAKERQMERENGIEPTSRAIAASQSAAMNSLPQSEEQTRQQNPAREVANASQL